jgi:hypothetical protein
MKVPCSVVLATLFLALPTLALSKQSDAQVSVQKELSPGVRLYSVNGERQRFARTIRLASGTHVFRFNYAYDNKRDHGGKWVSRFTVECSFDQAGTYTLRSKDSKVPDQVPIIWIESQNQAAPKCARTGA